jgi:hypothetical protein
VEYLLANMEKSPHFDEDPDPHKMKPNPDRACITVKSPIRIRVKVKTWIKIRMKVMWTCNISSL